MSKFDVAAMKQISIKVEIWADVVCPWCYIGKRRFEQAFDLFEHKNNITIEWKSFQLDPNRKTEPGKNINQMLAEKKGWTVDYAKKMNENLTDLASKLGLTYNFDKTIVANTFDAHRLIQFAKKKGLGDAAEEGLFKAYFTDGYNIADHHTLIGLGTNIGLKADETSLMLEGNEFAGDVNQDIYEARQMGVQGVPCFIINNKYKISGAQQPEAILNALNLAWEKEKP